jgi:hypothetical protein
MKCSRVRRAFPLHVWALVTMAALSASAVFAQAAAPAPQSAGVDSPDALSPVRSQMQSHAQVSGTTQDQASSQPQVLSYGTPGIQITVLEDTLLRVITDQPLSTKRSKDSTPVSFTVSEDVIVNHVLIIPRGATVHGEVVQDKKAGRITGSPELTLKLISLDLGGKSYPLYTYQFKVRGASKTKPTAAQIEGGAVVGALAGGVVSSSADGGATRAGYAEDMAAGAAAGVGAVAAVSASTPRPVLAIPAESQMDFYLAAPISVQPVSAKEAEQLAQRLHPGAPVLYIRGDTP